MFFGIISESNGTAIANIVVFHTTAHIFILCSNQKLEDLKKLECQDTHERASFLDFCGHPKEVAIGRIFLDVIIV